jgi:Flp pilus assembly protein CpaB
MRTSELGPVLTDRLRQLLGTRGWPRVLTMRRAIAVLLVLLAGLLALRSPPAQGATTPVVVVARDLAPGTTIGSGDVVLRQVPAAAVPDHAVTATDAATGRVTTGAARAGEPLTDVRLVGVEAARLSSGDPDAAAVPVRLSDAGIGELLRPGIRVDVVMRDPEQPGDPVLATDAVVVAVRAGPAPTGEVGQLVVIALPREQAARVAAASLGQPMTITLR